MKKQNHEKEKNNREKSPSPWEAGKQHEIGKDEKILLEVKEHPFTRNPLMSVCAIIIIMLAGLLSYLIIPYILMPIFVYLFFIISMASFFIPSHYTFTEEKIVINRIVYTGSFPWKRFRSYKFDKNGLYLSPLSNPERFDRFRGVFLVMGEENREKVSPILEEKIIGTEGN